ncbi:ATPase inhibitor mai-2, mitochondrial-like [Homarus americanus]|uniref:ATP synthase F1 subunit epsilon n=1 Tax=Homarus americanus TaxID=6706 RepID=A0A8J5KNZ2_HOMAM|nr:ATPase inhibitor mai-2, mitochondrial-like [Homarus americanus]KAG7170859.1 ATPase inhibitor mai-2-like 2 [Homarus americanus]
MALTSRTVFNLRSPLALCVRVMSTGDAGSGVGHGGGTGGTIRDAGGAFGKREVALENQYFRRLQHQQLEKMRAGIEEEVVFHKEQVEAHEEAIKRHHRILDELNMNIRNIVARDKMTKHDS